MKKKLLITGVSGLLGGNLAFALRETYAVTGWYYAHQVYIPGINARRVDIGDAQAVKDSLADDQPDIVLHCASLTNIDYCEENKEETRRINVQGTEHIASACSDPNTKLVYISTDAVYDGKKGQHTEEDPVSPCNYYGLTKYEAEDAVKRHENHLITRTNIFGWNIQNKHSLAEWILYSLERGLDIKGFDDAIFSSIYTMEFARIIVKMLERDLTGVFNLASRAPLSKFKFSERIAEIFHKKQDLIKPISVDDSAFTARRGKNLSLDTRKLSKVLGEEMPTMEECIERFFEDHQSGICDEIKRCCCPSPWYPSLEMIGYARQSVDDSDIDAVVKVLRSPQLTQGKKIEELESALCAYTGAKYAVAVSSGTAALHIACLASGLQDGDEFITSPNTFVASANCGVYCRANPVFADIRLDTCNIDPTKIREKITCRTKVVIPVHFAGQICDMEEIQNIVRAKQEEHHQKIFIIEDASHALGSTYKGLAAGSGRYSDMTVMSFHPVKHITTGEGGVVFTNDKKLHKQLRFFRSHGITSTEEDFVFREQAFGPDGMNPWYYEQQALGYNYRITDIQSALGLSQLEKIHFFVKRRRRIFETYHAAFADNELIELPTESEGCYTNWHLYVLKVDFDELGKGRSDVMRMLRRQGVGTQVHYIPVHTQPFYRKNFHTNWGDCPCAEGYYRRGLSIPLFPAMREADVKKVIKEINAVICH